MIPYNPNNLNYPYNLQNTPIQTLYNRSEQLIRVNGLEGAKAYQMSANSTVALFDNNEDLMYIKVTDGAGFPGVRTFRFEEIKETAPAPNNDYVTRKELESYVQQFIQPEHTNNKSESNKSGKTNNE